MFIQHLAVPVGKRRLTSTTRASPPSSSEMNSPGRIAARSASGDHCETRRTLPARKVADWQDYKRSSMQRGSPGGDRLRTLMKKTRAGDPFVSQARPR